MATTHIPGLLLLLLATSDAGHIGQRRENVAVTWVAAIVDRKQFRTTSEVL